MNISLNRPVISIFYGDANNNIKLLSIPLAKTYFHKWHIKGGWGGGGKGSGPGQIQCCHLISGLFA